MKKIIKKSANGGKTLSVITAGNAALRALTETEQRQKDDAHFITVLGKFRIDTQFVREVESRLRAVEHMLLDGVEYEAEELIWGRLFYSFDPNKWPEIVISLKYLAAQPDPVLEEVSWDSFRLAGTGKEAA